MKNRYSPRKLRPAVASSLNTRHRAVLAMLFILALVVSPTLIPQHGLLTSARAEAATSPTSPNALPSTDDQTRARAAESFGKLPLYFVENRGQLDKRVGYYVQGSDKTIYFTNKGLTFLNDVTSLINNGSLTQAQGQALIDAANAIKADIGC